MDQCLVNKQRVHTPGNQGCRASGTRIPSLRPSYVINQLFFLLIPKLLKVPWLITWEIFTMTPVGCPVTRPVSPPACASWKDLRECLPHLLGRCLGSWAERQPQIQVPCIPAPLGPGGGSEVSWAGDPGARAGCGRGHSSLTAGKK